MPRRSQDIRRDSSIHRIYLALKPIMSGQTAKIRKYRVVKQAITNNRHRRDVDRLLRDFSPNDVFEVAKQLLKAQVFESSLMARDNFPELFESSNAPAIGAEARHRMEAQTSKVHI